MNRLILIFCICFCIDYCVEAQNKDGANHKFEVLLFISPDCPICQKYMAKLNGFAKDFSKDVLFKGIIPGKTKKKDIKNFKKDYNINFSVKSDRGNYFVNRFKPMVTPEVVLLTSDGEIKYQGAIDNWFYELGKYRHQPTEQYLIDAIQAVLNGQEPTLQKTEAIGCIIQADLKGEKMVMDPAMHDH